MRMKGFCEQHMEARAKKKKKRKKAFYESQRQSAFKVVAEYCLHCLDGAATKLSRMTDSACCISKETTSESCLPLPHPRARRPTLYT